MRRALAATAIAALALLAPSCQGAGRSELDAAQCRLLPAEDVARAVTAASPAGVLFDHEEDHDGTWCLFNTAAGRIETRFQPGQESDVAAERVACVRDGGGPSHDVGTQVGVLLFCPYGLASATGFTNGFLITVHALDSTNAEGLTTSVARIALTQCCPST
jgi:hypothetical protein